MYRPAEHLRLLLLTPNIALCVASTIAPGTALKIGLTQTGALHGAIDHLRTSKQYNGVQCSRCQSQMQLEYLHEHITASKRSQGGCAHACDVPSHVPSYLS